MRKSIQAESEKSDLDKANGVERDVLGIKDSPTGGVANDTGGIFGHTSELIGGLGGGSATDKLLGLDMRPTMAGTLNSPPGNSDFLRHLSPTMRRTLLRNMLSRQRKRMKRLAGFLKGQRENLVQEEDVSSDMSFVRSINVPVKSDQNELMKAIDELGRCARMLDVLDELLSMQDHTIGHMGTFSKG